MTKNILLVDCHETVRYEKALLEKKHGYEVDWADSIPAAISELEKRKGRTAVVIEPIMSLPSEEWLMTEGKKLSERYLGFSTALFNAQDYLTCGLGLVPLVRELEPSARIVAYSLWSETQLRNTIVGKRIHDLLIKLDVPHVEKPNIGRLVEQIESTKL